LSAISANHQNHKIMENLPKNYRKHPTQSAHCTRGFKTLVALGMLIFSAVNTFAGIFNVTNLNDSGEGSLRWAIEQANASAGPHTINFSVIGTIILSANPLPALQKDYTIIDASSQWQGTWPDGSPGIAIDGAALSAGNSGILIGASYCEIRGLHIKNVNKLQMGNGIFIPDYNTNNVIGGTGEGMRNVITGNYRGIEIWGNNNTVIGNYVGVDDTGMAAAPNEYAGVAISGDGNTIGGNTPEERNIISGNLNSGIIISGQNTTVSGNYIGPDKSGTAAVANEDAGIKIMGNNNIIGGVASGAGNVISGNGFDGIVLHFDHCYYNLIQGNYIGTTADGISALGNGGAGIYITNNAHHNTIGGTETAARNIISGNGWGIYIDKPNTSHNTIKGNYIGLNLNGAARPNIDDGIAIFEGAGNNIIGGPEAGAGNVISGNGFSGIYIGWAGDEEINGTVIRGNYIGTDPTGMLPRPNTEVGILLNEASNNSEVIGNLISGNTGDGISVEGGSHSIKGNIVGTNKNKTAALANNVDGVSLLSDGNIVGGTAEEDGNYIAYNGANGMYITKNENLVYGNTIRNNQENGIIIAGCDEPAQNNVIGGTAPGEANVINNNGESGVLVYGVDEGAGWCDFRLTDCNRISGNSMYENSIKGIMLEGSGNGPGTSPSITPPVITSFEFNESAKSATLFVEGTDAGANAAVEIFIADSPTSGQGKTYLGTITSNAGGEFSGTLDVSGSGMTEDDEIVATTTHTDDNTSEFSIIESSAIGITDYPFIESFDVLPFPPEGWLNYKTGGPSSGLWNRATSGGSPSCSPKSGAAMVRYNCYSYGVGTKGNLVTPALHFEDDQFYVNFWMYRDGGYSSDADRVNIYYNSESNTGGATLLGTINRSRTLAPVVPSNGWYEYQFEMPAGATGTSYIIFEGVSEWGNNIFLDHVKVAQIPTSPIFLVNPDSWDFGTVDVGAQSAPKQFVITNDGIGVLNVNAPTLSNETDFSLTFEPADFPAALNAGETVIFNVIFAPQSGGAITGNVNINYGDSKESASITLSGNGFVRPAGSTCFNPYLVTLPVVDYADNTQAYGNDYSRYWVTPDSRYLNGYDFVAKFTLSHPGNLSGSVEGEWTGLFILQECPDPTNPAQVLFRASGSNGGSFSNLELTAGDYFAIVSTFPSPDYTDFVLNLSFVPELTECLDPTNLTTSGITTNSAVLDWTEGSLETSWNMKHGPSGFDFGTQGTLIEDIDKPYLLEGLEEGTSYDFYVQAICSQTLLSDWVGPHTFSTLSPPVLAAIQQGSGIYLEWENGNQSRKANTDLQNMIDRKELRTQHTVQKTSFKPVTKTKEKKSGNPSRLSNTCETAVTAIVGTNYSPLAPYWFEFTPATNGLLTISSCIAGQDADTDLYVYDACGGNVVAENDDWDDCIYEEYASRVSFYAQAGISYKIFWDDSWDAGDFDFTLNFDGTYVPGPGDICETAVEAVVGTNTAPYAPYWFEFTPDANTYLSVSSCLQGQEVDTYLYVYDDCGGNEIAFNDDQSGCSFYSGASGVSFFAQSGIAYKIFWDDEWDASGFDFLLETGDPCTVVCPPEAIAENEACGQSNNDGCFYEPANFDPINPGDVICGTLWADWFSTLDVNFDSDWFEYETTEPTTLVWKVTAEFPFEMYIMDESLGCDGESLAFTEAEACEEAMLYADVLPGKYWLVVMPHILLDYLACGEGNNYVAEFTTFAPHYNVFRNGEFLLSTTENSYFDEDVENNLTYCYTVSEVPMPGIETGMSNEECVEFIPVGVPDYRTVTGTITQDETVCMDAKNTITVQNFIAQSGSNINLIAGYSIVFLPSTHIQNEATLRAWITEAEEFCAQQPLMLVSAGNNSNADESMILEDYSTPEYAEDKNFRAYPNPTTGIFTLEVPQTGEESTLIIEVYNMIGENILHAKLPAESHYTLDLTGRQPGIYIVRVIRGNEMDFVKVVKR
jgi:hypothetical protein